MAAFAEPSRVASPYRFGEFPQIKSQKGCISRWIRNPQNLPMVGKVVECVVRYDGEEHRFRGQTDSEGLCRFNVKDALDLSRHSAGKKGFLQKAQSFFHKKQPASQEQKMCEAVFTVFEKDYYYTGVGCERNEYYPICHPQSVVFTPSSAGNILPDLEVDFHQFQPDIPAQQKSKDHALFPKWKFTLSAAGNVLNTSMRKLWARVCGIVDPVHPVAHIQEVFPTPYSNRKATEKDVTEFLLNEFPASFRVGKTPDTLRVRVNLDKYQQRKEKDAPQLTKGTYTFNYVDGHVKGISSVKVRLKNDETKILHQGEKGFKKAVRLLLCAVQVDQQVSRHLGIGHFVTEQLAMVVFGCLSDTNPIKQFLIPHLKGIFAINLEGEEFIFGPEGVLAESALTPKGIRDRVRDTVASADWSTYLPPQPMNQEHIFARLAQFYWEAWIEAATAYYDKHEAEIVKHQAELDRASEVFVKTSPAFYPQDGKEDTHIWFDKNGVSGRHDSWRVEMDGELKSAAPITDSLFTSDNRPKDIPTQRARWIQFIAYAGFNATFRHDHLHDAQSKTSSSLNFAVLAPNNDAAKPFNGVKQEAAAAQLSLVHILTHLITTHLMENPHGDIKSDIVQIISRKFEEMKDPEKFPDTPENRALLALFQDHLDKGRLGTDA